MCSTAPLRHLVDVLREHPSSQAKELAEKILALIDKASEQWVWKFGNRRFDLRNRVLIMGILNVTPDSFSDGGKYFAKDRALRRAEEMVNEGADIIDVGGESSRPGAQPVSVQEELRRVVPVIRAIKERLDIPVSIDTYKYEVAGEAIAAGAEIVNDITGLRHSARMKTLIAEHGVGVVIMHMQGTPQTMQVAPHYDDVVEEIGAFLEHQLSEAKQAGVEEECIVVDPGIGFGKLLEHNLEILANLGRLRARCQRPLLIGVSRKSFIGQLLGGIPPDERLAGGLGAVLSAVMNGANIVRVHDVSPTRQALTIYESIAQFNRKG
ncbi:dihydropteroate synthase [Candidatus Sumerlaeota bacterium]|nr:dihydropteroate synthase [Candidatus Sumerlaeota bacterium]